MTLCENKPKVLNIPHPLKFIINVQKLELTLKNEEDTNIILWSSWLQKKFTFKSIL